MTKISEENVLSKTFKKKQKKKNNTKIKISNKVANYQENLSSLENIKEEAENKNSYENDDFNLQSKELEAWIDNEQKVIETITNQLKLRRKQKNNKIEDESVKIECSVIKIQWFFKAYLWRKAYQVKLKEHKREIRMKQFPLDFNESNFIIHNFSKLSRRKRISASEDRLTDIATTEYSKENWETNKSTNSEGNYSDNFNDFYINPHIRSKVYLEETKMYDPERDSDNSQIARTKQKVYVKYEKLKQRSYSDSSCSEESDTDDPIRKMLKSNIHKIYEANDDQLYSQVIIFSCLISNRV